MDTDLVQGKAEGDQATCHLVHHIVRSNPRTSSHLGFFKEQNPISLGEGDRHPLARENFSLLHDMT